MIAIRIERSSEHMFIGTAEGEKSDAESQNKPNWDSGRRKERC
jgi:hypothetical protein